MSTIACNIVLIPGDDLALRSIMTSRRISDVFDAFFTLEDGKFYPHLSLYMFQLDEADIPKVKNVLSDIAANLEPVTAKATHYSLGTGWGVGYVDPEYVVSEELRSLQQRIIEAINPIRAGMRDSDIAKMQDATGIKLENLRKYGYPAVGELFRPHVTLSRLKEHRPEVLDLLPDIHDFDGAFVELGLYEIGSNGTCIRQLATARLSR